MLTLQKFYFQHSQQNFTEKSYLKYREIVVEFIACE